MGIVLSAAGIAPASAHVHRLRNNEMILFKRLSSNAEQQRESMKLDPILCMVARQRAVDMARRDYFSHTNPEGLGANILVRRAGFILPSYYDRSRSANSIESLGMKVGGPKEIVSLWLKSSGHRAHVLGEFDFFRAQTSVGVGVARSREAPYYKYYVFLSAPPNASLNPRAVILKNPQGVTIARSRPRAAASAPLFGIGKE